MIVMKNKSAYLKLAAALLKKAASEISNHGCNDYYIEDTVDNRIIFVEMMQQEDNEFKIEDVEKFVVQKKGQANKIIVQDWLLMYFLAEKLSVWSNSSQEKQQDERIEYSLPRDNKELFNLLNKFTKFGNNIA